MEQLAAWMPIILMVLTAIFIFKYFQNRKKTEYSVEEIQTNTQWRKYRWGLWIIMPLILFIDVLSNDMSGANMNIIPTILNFFISKEIILRSIRAGKISSYPKLIAILVSFSVLVVQISLGYFLWTYLI